MELIKNEQVQLSDISKAKKIYYRLMLFLYKAFNKSSSITCCSSAMTVIFNLSVIFIFKNVFGVLGEAHYAALMLIFAISSLTFYLFGIFISIKAPQKIGYYKNKLTKK